MHRDTDLGANASETPLLLHPPFSLLLKALLLWQTGAFVLVGSGRWAAEEQCHPPTHSCFPTCSSEHREHCSAQGSLACSWTLAAWPGLTLSLRGNKVRWHPVAVGLPQAGRKVWAGSLCSASGFSWRECTYALTAALLPAFEQQLLPSTCLFENVSHFPKKQIWRLSSGFCEID